MKNKAKKHKKREKKHTKIQKKTPHSVLIQFNEFMFNK